MTESDVLQLGSLARIRLTKDEAVSFSKEIDAILEYVSTINSLVTPADISNKVGPVYNVFRADEITVEPGSYTEAIMKAMPEREGDFLQVKKILNQSD